MSALSPNVFRSELMTALNVRAFCDTASWDCGACVTTPTSTRALSGFTVTVEVPVTRIDDIDGGDSAYADKAKVAARKPPPASVTSVPICSRQRLRFPLFYASPQAACGSSKFEQPVDGIPLQMSQPTREVVVAPDRFEVSADDVILITELRSAIAVCVYDAVEEAGALLHLRFIQRGSNAGDITDTTLATELLLLDRCVESIKEVSPTARNLQSRIVVHLADHPS